MNNCAVVVLAAGKGTRIRSDKPKVLHSVAGRTMIQHVLTNLEAIEPQRQIVVVAPDMDDVVQAVRPASVAVQTEALGTGHAVLAARSALSGFTGDVFILFGDTPLLKRETLETMLAARQSEAKPTVVLLGFCPEDPAQYGRIVLDRDNSVRAIIEYCDASDEDRAIRLCNSGAMVVDGSALFSLLESIGNNNAKGEYFLTDIVAVARNQGYRCSVVEASDATEVMGVNSRNDLAAAEMVMQSRLRIRAMEGGATLIGPETIWLSADTRIGRDVTIGPSVVIGPGTSIGDRVVIRAFSHVEGTEISPGAVVGPFARLRPGTKIMENVRVGNFVEIKEALVGEGARVSHLSYIGDAQVGVRANIGAGTITCNYDGFTKSRTNIGEGAFIGSNSALVAPVTIGDGAIVGAGSVITRDVNPDTLALTRSRQRGLEGGAQRFRRKREAVTNKDGG